MSFCAEWNKGRILRDWLRSIPLLKELPGALAVYFMDLEEMTDEQKRRVDPKEYLSSKIADRVSSYHCCSCLCKHTIELHMLSRVPISSSDV